jgi:hypothetical protein
MSLISKVIIDSGVVASALAYYSLSIGAINQISTIMLQNSQISEFSTTDFFGSHTLPGINHHGKWIPNN